MTFTITVYNQGTLEATSIEITDYVPSGMTNVDVDWLGDTFIIDSLAAGASTTVDIDLAIDPSFTGMVITNNAEITSALGGIDEDGDLSVIDGSVDDTSELGTDGDVDDEAPGTPGVSDNPADADDYDLAQITVGQDYDLACLLYTSPSPRDQRGSRMPSSA